MITIGVREKKFYLIPFCINKREYYKFIDGVPENITVGIPFYMQVIVICKYGLSKGGMVWYF